MKPKHIALTVLFIAIVVAIWMAVNRVETDLDPSKSAQSLTENVEPSTKEASAENVMPSTASPGPLKKVENVVDLIRRERKANEPWRAPIDFYGKVVDQAGDPVVGANVFFQWNNLNGTESKTVSSDIDGLFSLVGEEGKFLAVKVKITGYYSYSDNPYGFHYAGEDVNFVPDPNQPIVFRLQKKGQAEPLITADFPGFAKIVQFQHDGTPVKLDLLRGKEVASGGQLRLQFWRAPIEKTTRVFNWRCHLSVVGGGFLETEEEFNFMAPEDGYEPSIEIEMPVSDEQWKGAVRRKYYFRLADGRYGRIEFYVLARNGVFTVKSAINPSGSRNLEYDKAVQPKPAFYE